MISDGTTTPAVAREWEAQSVGSSDPSSYVDARPRPAPASCETFFAPSDLRIEDQLRADIDWGTADHSRTTVPPRTAPAIPPQPTFAVPTEDFRLWNRAAAMQIPDVDRHGLLGNREELLRKKYKGGGLSKSEERLLAFVRWQLDRIDDAELGHQLDALEKIAEVHEHFASRMETILDQMAQLKRAVSYSPRSRHGTKR